MTRGKIDIMLRIVVTGVAADHHMVPDRNAGQPKQPDRSVCEHPVAAVLVKQVEERVSIALPDMGSHTLPLYALVSWLAHMWAGSSGGRRGFGAFNPPPARAFPKPFPPVARNLAPFRSNRSLEKYVLIVSWGCPGNVTAHWKLAPGSPS